MKKYLKKIILSAILIQLLFSCNNSNTLNSATIRSILQVDSNGVLNSEVYIEGLDGQAVNGALVYILSPSNITNLLNFDYTRGCYYSKLGLPETGEYTISVESNAYSGTEQNIEFKTLESEFNIVSIQGDNGLDAFLGQDLETNHSVSISWTNSTNSTVYIIELTKPNGSVFKTSTTETNQILNSELFSEFGNYSISLEAQYITGDPLFKEENFYAVNNIKTSQFYFGVVE